MKLAVLLPLATAAAVAGGCATVFQTPPEALNAEARLDRGLAAAEAGAYAEAMDELTWVYGRCAGSERSLEALAALAALQLDPRNPMARPDLGTDLLGRLIRHGSADAWTRPLAETTFLAALALGAPDPDSVSPAEPLVPEAGSTAPGRVYGCGDELELEAGAPGPLPALPGPSMALLLAEMEARNDALSLRVDSLEADLATAREALNATREELERIRKTLKP